MKKIILVFEGFLAMLYLYQFVKVSVKRMLCIPKDTVKKMNETNMVQCKNYIYKRHVRLI